jgi:AcrR family transcriptional regulator
MTDPTPTPAATPKRTKLGRPPTLDRDAALAAAHNVIAERGFDRTRYADVAEAAGVPVTTLQHAFGSLQGLLLAAIQRSTAAEIAVLRGMSDDPALAPWDRLVAFLGGAVQHTADTKFWRLWTEFFALAGRDPAIGEYAGQLYAQWWDYLEQLVTLGVASGDFTSPIAQEPRTAAIAIDGLVDGLALTLIVRADGPDYDLAREVSLKAVASMLGYAGPVVPLASQPTDSAGSP